MTEDRLRSIKDRLNVEFYCWFGTREDIVWLVDEIEHLRRQVHDLKDMQEYLDMATSGGAVDYDSHVAYPR